MVVKGERLLTFSVLLQNVFFLSYSPMKPEIPLQNSMESSGAELLNGLWLAGGGVE